MELTSLNSRSGIEQNKKLTRRYAYFETLIGEINKKELPDEIVITINEAIEIVNSIESPDKLLFKQLRKSQLRIITLLEKELKIVPKKLYQTRWLAIGMSAFGIPMGVAFGASLDNMGFIGIGLPLGMVIGMVIGAAMDKKAFQEGRQLDLDFQG